MSGSSSAMPTDSREEIVIFAKLADRSGRYEEMMQCMGKLAKRIGVEELNLEERNLLALAYKNVIGACRAQWRIISSIEQEEVSKAPTDHHLVASIQNYKRRIEAEIREICNEVLSIMDTHTATVLPPPSDFPVVTSIVLSASLELDVYCLKMKGDYNRVVAEFSYGKVKKTATERALEAYKIAYDFHFNLVAPTHLLTLELALNFSLFCYENLMLNKACNLAEQAIQWIDDDAAAAMDEVSQKILIQLEDKYSLWSAESEVVRAEPTKTLEGLMVTHGGGGYPEAVKREKGRDLERVIFYNLTLPAYLEKVDEIKQNVEILKLVLSGRIEMPAVADNSVKQLLSRQPKMALCEACYKEEAVICGTRGNVYYFKCNSCNHRFTGSPKGTLRELKKW